jgi:hypothetical protein
MKKVVGRNPLRIVIAEGEANIVEGALKTIDYASSFALRPPFVHSPYRW